MKMFKLVREGQLIATSHRKRSLLLKKKDIDKIIEYDDEK